MQLQTARGGQREGGGGGREAERSKERKVPEIRQEMERLTVSWLK